MKITNVLSDQVTLSWKASPYETYAPVDNYIIDKRESWKSSWGFHSRVKSDTTTLCVKNLREGQEYFFRVYAENIVGYSSAIENDHTVTPKSPYGK